jgi:hypothetical protein
VHVKHLLALLALKVVVVVMVRQLITCVFAGQFHLFERAILGQAFQISVNGGDAQTRHAGLRSVQHLMGQQWACRIGNGIAYR